MANNAIIHSKATIIFSEDAEKISLIISVSEDLTDYSKYIDVMLHESEILISKKREFILDGENSTSFSFDIFKTANLTRIALQVCCIEWELSLSYKSCIVIIEKINEQFETSLIKENENMLSELEEQSAYTRQLKFSFNRENPAGTINGINRTFSTSKKIKNSEIILFVNGLKEKNFSIVNDQAIEIQTAPLEGDVVEIIYNIK